jgi:hypothetical protein
MPSRKTMQKSSNENKEKFELIDQIREGENGDVTVFFVYRTDWWQPRFIQLARILRSIAKMEAVKGTARLMANLYYEVITTDEPLDELYAKHSDPKTSTIDYYGRG